MSSYLKEIDWPSLLHNADIESAVECFYNMISPAVDQFFPKIKVKMSLNESAFISPRVKLLLKKRRILIQKGMVLEADSLQVTIDNLIQQNQINGVRSKNNKHCKSTRGPQWWKTVNTISGRESKKCFP